jgi:fused signal recognition particle receptor
MLWRKKSKEKPEALEAVSLPKRSFGKDLKAVFSRIKFDLEDLTTLEDTLLQADFGVDSSAEIIKQLQQRAKAAAASSSEELKQILSEILFEGLTRSDVELNLDSEIQPYVILVVGVNGVGKTTTIGKLANYLGLGGAKITLGAADTFRAAAVDQLRTWGERAGAQVIGPKTEGQDPAAVAFETIEQAINDSSDIVLIDTAGRLQNKAGLMDELAKIRRIIEKKLQVNEVLLVLDATTGQNALAQAKAFTEVVNVTGLVLTKMDGSAKGGIVYAIQNELDIPVKLVGFGEGINDFGFFDAKEFVSGLLGDN